MSFSKLRGCEFKNKMICEKEVAVESSASSSKWAILRRHLLDSTSSDSSLPPSRHVDSFILGVSFTPPQVKEIQQEGEAGGPSYYNLLEFQYCLPASKNTLTIW